MEKRIYQIAKELNISHVQILKFLESKEIQVQNHMAFVGNDIYDSILLEFSKEKKQVDRVKKERARKAIVDSPEKFKSIVNIDAKDKPSNPKTSFGLTKKDYTHTDENAVSKKPIGVNTENSESDDSENSKKQNIRKLKKVNISDIADKIQKNTKLKGSPNKRLNISESIKNTSKKSKKKIKKKIIDVENTSSSEDLKKLNVPKFTSVDELSKLMKVSAQDVIMKCMEKSEHF